MHTSERDGIAVKWKVEAGTIYVDYELTIKTLSKGLAVIKLNYLPGRSLKRLTKTHHSLRQLAEETLAYGLSACVLLTREYPTRPDVFFFNLAIGVRLATVMRKVFSDLFDWYNWTPYVPKTQEPHQPRIGEVF